MKKSKKSIHKLSIRQLLKSETTGYELLELARRLNIPNVILLFIEDLHTATSSTVTNYIINLRSPEHWCGLHIDGKNAYYFNSYSSYVGGSYEKIVSDFCKRNKLVLHLSSKPIQRTTTGYCGVFVIDFLGRMNKVNGMPSSIHDFNNYNLFLQEFKDTSKQIKQAMF